jgi:hypothetical protein
VIKIIIIAAQKTVETFYCVYLWNPECSRMLKYNIKNFHVHHQMVGFDLLLQVKRNWKLGAHGNEGAAPLEHWPGTGVPA